MRLELEHERKPLGGRENPAKTCKDLYYAHPYLEDGKLSLPLGDRVVTYIFDRLVLD